MIPPRIALMPSFALLAGCAEIANLQDKVEGLTNRFVLEGFYLGVSELENDVLADALADTEFGSGATVTAFLADASSAGEIESAPIRDASVAFLSPSAGGSMGMVSLGDGQYELTGDDGLRYVAGEVVAITATYEGQNRRIPVDAPPRPSPGISGYHAAGEPLVVDLSGQGFESTMVTVLEIASGRTTWSNLPVAADDFYDLTHGGTGEVRVTLPGSALPVEGVYAVGVAGVYTADPDEFEEVNTALSALVAAQFRFSTVCTFADTNFCE